MKKPKPRTKKKKKQRIVYVSSSEEEEEYYSTEEEEVVYKEIERNPRKQQYQSIEEPIRPTRYGDAIRFV